MKLKKVIFSTVIIFALVLNSIFLIKLSINYNQTLPNELISNHSRNESIGKLQHLNLQTNYNKVFMIIDDKKEIVNNFNYNYIIKPNDTFCDTKNSDGLLLVAFVPISPKNFNHRKVIRSTWANHQLLKNFRVVFMIGESSQKELNDEIMEESKLNGDIVQLDFADTYFNLTTKTIMGFKWVSTYCSNAKYTLKVDDDVVVNINRLLKFVKRISTNQAYQTNHIFGRFFDNGAPVVRVNISKFYLSKEEHPNDFFVPYCEGPSYMLTTDLTRKMYGLSFFTTQFKFEDVYVGVNFFFILLLSVVPEVVTQAISYSNIQ
jgi:hypothetical protein